MRARLAFLREYRAPYRSALLRVGWWRAAPASWTFLTVTLLVSLAWRVPGAHAAAALCCGYRANDLETWPRALRLLASPFLALRTVEIVWAVVATWLLLVPLEAAIGTRRAVLIGVLGNLLPTAAIGLAWLATHPGALAPLDVGTSAVVVAGGAALVVFSRSPEILGLYLVGMAVDVFASPDLATAEHLLALATGAAMALMVRRGRRQPARLPEPNGSRP